MSIVFYVTETKLEPPTKKARSESRSKGDSKSKAERGSERSERRSASESEMVTADGRVERHVTLSPRTPGGDPPEPEELVRMLHELEGSASGDAAVREKIAALPPAVSEPSFLTKLEDRAAAEQLASQVDEAVQLLNEYNARLTAELEARRRAAVMLRDFLQLQRELLQQAERRLEEYGERLHRVYGVRHEIKAHMQNLPDLTQLPDVTGGLAPLPSAGDLFSLH